MNDADVMRLLHEVYHLRRSIAALSAHAIRLRAREHARKRFFTQSMIFSMPRRMTNSDKVKTVSTFSRLVCAFIGPLTGN
jgi:hypothetical protein